MIDPLSARVEQWKKDAAAEPIKLLIQQSADALIRDLWAALEPLQRRERRRNMNLLRAEAAEARSTRLAAALRAFLKQWDLVEPHIADMFALQQVRSGRSYSGPNLANELADLRALLVDPGEEP